MGHRPRGLMDDFRPRTLTVPRLPNVLCQQAHLGMAGGPVAVNMTTPSPRRQTYHHRRRHLQQQVLAPIG